MRVLLLCFLLFASCSHVRDAIMVVEIERAFREATYENAADWAEKIRPQKSVDELD